MLRGVLLAVLALSLAACAKAPRETGINDPMEVGNRQVHAFNKALDRNVLKPLAGSGRKKAGTGSQPGLLARGVGNFAENISIPGTVVNDVLQLNFADAFHNTARFAMNSTVGLGGLFDVATQNGLESRPSDFGETLFVWGASEGPYMELPFIGPATQRDALGKVVDLAIDPVGRLVPAPQKYVGTAARLFARLTDRSRYGELIDSILYESADSYAQTRLLYLQSRRRALYGSLSDAELEDPYADQ